MSSAIFDKLKSFVITQAAVEEGEVTEDAQIEDDLGVTGDDAVDFIITYGKAFNVDVSNFMAADYFGSEGGIRVPVFFGSNKRHRKTLTVKHLEKGILAGRLDEEIINGE